MKGFVKKIKDKVIRFVFSAELEMADLDDKFIRAHYESIGGRHRDLAIFLNKLGLRNKVELKK